MNQDTAVQRGYERTGIYSFRAEEVRPRLEEIKAAGYKALLVTVPHSKYSRGYHGGCGYAVVVEPKYRLDNGAKAYQGVVANTPARIQALREASARKLEADIAEEMGREQEARKWLAENNYPTA